MSTTADELREEVRQRYAAAAGAARAGGCRCNEDGSCCVNVLSEGEDGVFGESL